MRWREGSGSPARPAEACSTVWTVPASSSEGYEHEQAKPYRLTDLGRHRLNRMHVLALTRFNVIYKRLDGGERRALVDLMHRVDRALEPPRRPMWWLE